MHIFGHHDGESNVPSLPGVSIFDRLDQVGSDVVVRQMIDSTSSATDRNEVTRFTWINPERDIVWQSFALGNPHGVAGTPRCGVRTAQRAVPTIRAVSAISSSEPMLHRGLSCRPRAWQDCS